MSKTFRGIIGSAGVNLIRLSTKKGKIGYRIINFQIMPTKINLTIENVMKIYKTVQASGSSNIDFADGNLLAAAILKVGSGSTEGLTLHTIFEQEIFNQDIYITSSDEGGGNLSCNYYLELETINMTDNATLVSTLRDIRLNPQVGA